MCTLQRGPVFSSPVLGTELYANTLRFYVAQRVWTCILTFTHHTLYWLSHITSIRSISFNYSFFTINTVLKLPLYIAVSTSEHVFHIKVTFYHIFHLFYILFYHIFYHIYLKFWCLFSYYRICFLSSYYVFWGLQVNRKIILNGVTRCKMTYFVCIQIYRDVRL